MGLAFNDSNKFLAHQCPEFAQEERQPRGGGWIEHEGYPPDAGSDLAEQFQPFLALSKRNYPSIEALKAGRKR